MVNGIVYSFHVREDAIEDNRCYKQIQYSIKTIRRFNKTIPIKVYISSSKNLTLPKIKSAEIISFENNFHLNVVERWKSDGFEEFLFHRWFNAFRGLEDFKFDNILYLDTDTIFHKDPEELFKRYGNTNFLWGKQDNSEKTMNLIGMKDGLNDGQFILNKSLISEKTDVLMHQIQYINRMLPEYDGKMEEFDFTNFHWLMVQYGAYDYFSSKDRMKYFDSKHVMIGSEPDASDTKSLILHHYFNGNYSKYVPAKSRL
jgi:lipopolysaccharide biosynthesis glycosyltransferase